jgi:predicted transposase/invertase (TIGR01784 family)
LRQELLEIKKNAKPGEEETMISNMGRNLQRYYYDEAILKGRKEGKLEGRLEGRLETAKRLLGMKFDDKLVTEATGLTLEEVEKLKREAGER